MVGLINYLFSLFSGKKNSLLALGAGVLVLLIALQWLSLKGLKEENKAQALELGQVIAANQSLELGLEALRAEKARYDAALAQREAAYHASVQDLAALRKKQAEARKSAPDYRAWADADLPAAVLGLLDGAADGNANASAQAGAAALVADRDAGAGNVRPD